MTTDSIATTQQWQCPAGVYYVDVVLRGGGGGGGGTGQTIRPYGIGGAVGGTTTGTLVAVTPGTYYNITIGAGGGGGGDSAGIAGGSTTAFGLTATGGAGGSGASASPNNGASGAGVSGGGAGTNGSLANQASNPGLGGAASGGGGGGAGYPYYGGTYFYIAYGGQGGSGVVNITYNLPVTDFTGTPLSGQYPLSTTWTNTTTGGDTYYWDFGNGTNTTDEDPAPTAYLPGTYTVALTATNEYGYSVKTRTDYVAVSRTPYSCSFLIVSDNLRGV